MSQPFKPPSARSQLVVVSDERKYPLDGIAVYYFKLNVKKMLTEDNVHRVSKFNLQYFIFNNQASNSVFECRT